MPKNHSVHVVLIQADGETRKNLVELLTQAGMRTTDYASAESFLAYPPATNSHCIVLDVELGTMSGLKLQARLLSEGQTVPIIFYTAHTEQTYRIMAQQLGCAGYIIQGAPDQDIVSAIRQVATNPSPHAKSLPPS